jgi:hypothetical protein
VRHVGTAAREKGGGWFSCGDSRQVTLKAFWNGVNRRHSSGAKDIGAKRLYITNVMAETFYYDYL